MKRLYFIAATDANGENVDLFVAAISITAAVAAWRAHYGKIAPGEDASIFDIEGEEPDRIFEVPAAPLAFIEGDAEVLTWHGDIKQVGGAKAIPSDD